MGRVGQGHAGTPASVTDPVRIAQQCPRHEDGIGFASGVGRSGAILAPIVIGTLVGMALPLEQNFIAIAIPAVIALIAVGLVNQSRSASAL